MPEPEKWKQGYLEKRKGPEGEVWWLRYRDGQRRPRQRVGLVSDYPTRREAQKAARTVRDIVNRPAVQVYRFGDVIARYLNEEIPQRYSTQRGYRRMIRLYIEPKWGKVLLDKVKAADVRLWIHSFDFAPRTKGHLHGMMKLLFTKAQLWEMYDQKAPNPMSFFSIEGGSKRGKEPRILSPQQFEDLLPEITNEMYRTMVITAMWLGLRCSELVGLKWEDLDYETKEVIIRRAVVDGRIDQTKTVASRARLPMVLGLESVLDRYREIATYKSAGDWIFPAPMGEGKRPVLPDNVTQKVLVPAGKRAGIPFPVGWHTFRHSFRAWMDIVGAEPNIQRDLMRHADIRTTSNVYGGAQMDLMRAVNEKVVGLVKIGKLVRVK